MRMMAITIAIALTVQSASAQEVYGPPAPVDIAPAPTVQDVPKPVAVRDDRACVKRWRARAYMAHAADVATTIAAVESGKGVEGNPLVRAMFGKKPKPHEVIMGKLALMAPMEFFHAQAINRGDYAGVCTSYKITAGIIGAVAAINLRVHF